MAATSRRAASLGHTPSDWESLGDDIFCSEFGGCSVVVYGYGGRESGGGPEYAFIVFDRGGGAVVERDGYGSLKSVVADADEALIDFVLG